MNEKTNQVMDKLKEVGLTVDEVKDWLGSFESGVDETPEQTNNNGCNIIFVPASNAENTQVLFMDSQENISEIKGVVRAGLDYDPELGFPVLRLELANPIIPDFNS